MDNFACVGERLAQVVRYHNYGDALAVELCDGFIELCGHERVKACGRFVAQNQLFCRTQRARKQDALPAGRPDSAENGRFLYSAMPSRCKDWSARCFCAFA